jgi:cell division protein FtsN
VAPKTQANPSVKEVPVVTPKPAEASAPQNAKPKGEAKQVVPIPPIDGRSGHSKTPTAPTAPTTASVAPPQTPPASPNKGNWTIQVGSFKDQGEADARASRLNSSGGGEARVVKADIPGKGIWYRVQVGRVASREAAVSYGNQLRAKNLISDFIPTSIGK